MQKDSRLYRKIHHQSEDADMEAMHSIRFIIMPKGKKGGAEHAPKDLAHTTVIRHKVMFQNLHAVRVSSWTSTKAHCPCFKGRAGQGGSDEYGLSVASHM